MAAIARWQSCGITHVVDTRAEYSDEALVARVAPGIDYLHNGAVDTGAGQPDEWFDVGTAWIRSAMADPDTKVLVHCHMGINRGPSLAFATMLVDGWDPVEAIDTIRRARPSANVGYAEDALHWHHRRTRATADQRFDDVHRLVMWRRANRLDVVRLIRQVRSDQAGN